MLAQTLFVDHQRIWCVTNQLEVNDVERVLSEKRIAILSLINTYGENKFTP